MGANAQTSVTLFVANAILTAQQQNFSAATGVPVFATTVTRDAAFGGSNKVLAEGQLCYLESTDVVQYYTGAAWATVGPTTSAVAQVKSTAKSDTFTTTSGTFVDVTGLTVSITPSSASNKILVLATINMNGQSGVSALQGQLVRDSTAINIGDAGSSRTRATFGNIESAVSNIVGQSIMFLDSPATTSSTTYKIQIRATTAAQTVVVNRASTDTDNASIARVASTITVMEVAP